MHKIHTKRAPCYLTHTVTATADLQSRDALCQYQQISDSADMLNLAREASPTQDLLRGTVSHIMFEK